MKRMLIACGVLLFGASVYLLGWSPLFAVSHVEVKGAPTPAAAARVEAVAAIARGDQLARIDQRAIAAKLEPLAWVDRVDIQRDWISKKVIIAITPRIPIARLNSLYLARDGKTFALPGGTSLRIPSVTASSTEAGVAAAQLFTSLPREFTDTVREMRAGNQSFTFIIAAPQGELQLRWGSNSDNELKLRVLQALLVAPENKAISRIDLSAPHAPIVK